LQAALARRVDARSDPLSADALPGQRRPARSAPGRGCEARRARAYLDGARRRWASFGRV